ncbi:MAG: bifunctional 4-hydroxy-3-methylbut-2-enyl diphosphate reductase/30S ribosomal protein S1, partial [Firmicutes bacterium]|nr:bifunctional 4-hydroxy-3-methylbut-2-enyl diphosphate reductase/30S ribosomal protein S1 [Bacillota bacterium]
MEVVLAPDTGFCLGVRKAVELAETVAEEAKATGRRVFTLGLLIHNRRVTSALESQGVRTVRSLDELAPGDVLILPSHGAPPEVAEKARAKGILLQDATCPLVRKVQTAAKTLREQGYTVVVVGQPTHTEVLGVLGWAGGQVRVVQNAEEAARLPVTGPVAVVAQTTQRPETVDEVVSALRGRGLEVKVEPTLCHATKERQRQARDLAARVDVLVVVGGKESANTQKLVEVGREMGRRVYHVEGADEVEPSWFRKGEKVGVTAGTSTPDWITEEVVARMRDIDPNTEARGAQEDTASAAGPEETQGAAPGQEQARAMQDVGGPEPGSRVRGTVVKVGETEVLVDIGYKTEAVLPLSEVSRRRTQNPAEVIKEGDAVEAVVLRVDGEGHPILSRRKIEEELTWSVLERAHAENLTIEAPVTAQVKGGLVADVGTRGFIPASQVGLEFIRDLAPYVGKTLRVKVIEVDRAHRKVILSERRALEEERARAKDELLAGLREGETRTGEVKRVTDYGAFVDIGGVDGLLHVSEMSWKRIADPREVVKEGDKIEVRVLKVDRERGRISLGLRQAQDDPWAKVAERFPVGSVVRGRVVSVADFGAFVELAEGVEGLVHV